MDPFPAINNVLAQADREIWLVTAGHGTARAGLVATFVNQASIVPEMPRVIVGLAKQHHTWQAVERGGGFVLHLVGEDQVELVWRFGLQSGRDGDKWTGIACEEAATGGPRLAGALAWLDCRVEATLDTGDRSVYVAEVLAGRTEKAGRPLTMRRLLELATPDRLRQLKAGLERDAIVDGAAIRAWRAR